MKKLFFVSVCTLALGAIGILHAYDRKDALKNWVDTDTCIGRCEKAEKCIDRKTDSGPNGRTACSDKCAEICEKIGEEKGEF